MSLSEQDLQRNLTRRELLGWSAATAASSLIAASAGATLVAKIIHHTCPPTQTPLECRKNLDYKIAPPLTAGIFFSLLAAWFAGHWVPDTFPRNLNQRAQPSPGPDLPDGN